MDKTRQLFCFGYGYTCDYLGHDLLKEGGWGIAGSTRDPEKKKELQARGVDAYIFDYDHPLVDPQYILSDTTHLLISTPADEDGDPAFGIHAQDILGLKNLQWVGYLSTTGVYGDRGGEWVDETAEVRPTTKRGSRRARAEEQWLSLLKQNGLPVHIFRLSGIYGPGRSALDSVRAGVARCIRKEGHAFGRIHVEDIVQVLRASMENPKPGEIYNVTDSNPAPSHEVIAYACELLKRPVPPMVDFDQADMAPITRSFYMDNRRVKNGKIKSDLGITLKYDDYKAGLKGCLDAEDYALSLFKKPVFTGSSGTF